MATYYLDGELVTDKRGVAVSETWDTQTEWEAFQSKNQTQIVNGVLKLDTVALIDNFEDGDIAEYGGDTTVATVQQSVVNNGSYALEITASANAGISSTTGLDNYPVQDQPFKCDFRIGADGNGYRILFATQSETSLPDSYQVRFNADLDELNLRLRSGGAGTTLATTAVNWANYLDNWLTAEVDWKSDGTISVTILDSTGSSIASVSATDTTFSSGGFGVFANQLSGDAIVYVDYARYI